MSEGWWEAFYDLDYAELALVEGPIAETTRFLTEVLRLEPGSRVYEQCCGVGRFARGLAASGELEVIGLDQSEAYVERARELCADLQRPPRFVAGDAYDYVPERPVDAVFNWATSFGYSHDDAENARMLERAFEALADGGRFALDYHNVPALLRDFQRTFVHRTPDGTVVLRECELDLERGLLRSHFTWLGASGERRTLSGDTRLYMPHELGRMCAAAGFVDVAFYGGVDGSALSSTSPRCIVVTSRRG